MTGPESSGENGDAFAEAARRYNRGLGLTLFTVYLVLYGGFVAVVALDYRWTATKVPGGLNVAVAWGLGLIVSAFVLALAYMAMARPESASRRGERGSR